MFPPLVEIVLAPMEGSCISKEKENKRIKIPYVCKYTDSPLWSVLGIGHPLGLGGGAIKKVQCPNAAGTIGPASHMLAHTCTERFL